MMGACLEITRGEGIYATQHEPAGWHWGRRMRVLLNNYSNGSPLRADFEDADSQEVLRTWSGRSSHCIPLVVPTRLAYNIFERQTSLTDVPAITPCVEDLEVAMTSLRGAQLTQKCPRAACSSAYRHWMVFAEAATLLREVVAALKPLADLKRLREPPDFSWEMSRRVAIPGGLGIDSLLMAMTMQDPSHGIEAYINGSGRIRDVFQADASSGPSPNEMVRENSSTASPSNPSKLQDALLDQGSSEASELSLPSVNGRSSGESKKTIGCSEEVEVQSPEQPCSPATASMDFQETEKWQVGKTSSSSAGCNQEQATRQTEQSSSRQEGAENPEDVRKLQEELKSARAELAQLKSQIDRSRALSTTTREVSEMQDQLQMASIRRRSLQAGASAVPLSAGACQALCCCFSRRTASRTP
ncbi:unnamed protein product [Symbiodinium sp. KB8]|nr:unnamed protein product [Symbiodinium sp. KB8]